LTNPTDGPGEPSAFSPYGGPPQPPPGGGYPAPYAGGYPGGSGHPVQVNVERSPTQSRVLALFSIPFDLARAIAAIPVMICLYVLGIVIYIVAWIGMWAVLFTGSYPEGMHSFVVGYLRWATRLQAWLLGITDKYPGFSMQP
jgi:hypothetical protein